MTLSAHPATSAAEWFAPLRSRLTQYLDEAWALSCEFTAHTGADKAAWILFPSCCSVNGRAYILGCDACKNRKISETRSLRCDVCGARYRPASLAWRWIEPIR